ncbi:MAG: ACT domain-containing protein [bacterium]|nr:MAG: ACT domain-containing protein [bacterium]
MALNNEEAIYKITRAIYDRLGDKIERPLVEALVIDIFTALKPAFDSLETLPTNASIPSKKLTVDSPSTQRYIISVFGLDQPGIVGKIAGLLGDSNCSIIDINQTVVQGKFAMIMIIDATHTTQDMGYLRETFRTIGERLGVRIYIHTARRYFSGHASCLGRIYTKHTKLGCELRWINGSYVGT